MDTLTSTATKAATGAKLLIATFAMFGAGAVALATVPLNNLAVNGVPVKSCVGDGDMIQITRTNGTMATLTNGCQPQGKYYNYVCIRPTAYMSSWSACNYKDIKPDLTLVGYADVGMGISGIIGGNYIQNSNEVVLTPSSMVSTTGNDMYLVPTEFRIKNLGQVEAKNVKVEFYYSGFTDGKPFITKEYPSVTGFQRIVLNDLLAIPAVDGTLTIKIDPQNVIPEMVESNNEYTFSIKFQVFGVRDTVHDSNDMVYDGSTSTVKTCGDAFASVSTLQYFQSCNTSGYASVCLNKYSLQYQGCSDKDGNGCINANINAASNIRCLTAALNTTSTFGL